MQLGRLLWLPSPGKPDMPDGWGGVNCVHRSDSAESRWGTASSNPSLNRWKAAASMVGWLHSLHAYIGVMRSAGVLLAVE